MLRNNKPEHLQFYLLFHVGVFGFIVKKRRAFVHKNLLSGIASKEKVTM